MNAPENISNKPLRVAMPKVAAFIDDMRAAFGAEGINASIKGGMSGVPTFYAKENGYEVGTAPTPPKYVVNGTQMVIGNNAEILKKGQHADRKIGR